MLHGESTLKIAVCACISVENSCLRPFAGLYDILRKAFLGFHEFASECHHTILKHASNCLVTNHITLGVILFFQ
jgi:hypothetical protein